MKKARKPRLGFSIFSMKRNKIYELRLNQEQICHCIEKQIRHVMARDSDEPLGEDVWIDIRLATTEPLLGVSDGEISALATWEETHEADPGG